MAEDPQECADLAKVADGLCINLGQLTEAKKEAILASVQNRGDRPWLLDPVAVGALPSRLKFAQQLLEYKPTIIRGNASEIYALATGKASGSGTDSDKWGLSRKDWFDLAGSLSVKEVVATDIQVRKAERDVAYTHNGELGFDRGFHLMGRFSGFGCALSAVCATLGNGWKTIETYNRAGRRAGDAPSGDFRNAFVSHLMKETCTDQIRDMLRLYFVAGAQDHPNLDGVLKDAQDAGITCFQHRDKTDHLSEKKRYKHTVRVAQQNSVPWIHNDSVKEAKSFAADGVHLGQTDGDPKEAREKLGPDAIIGLSISKPEDWAKYDTRYVDYVGIGPFAATQTKRDARQPLGAEGIRELRKGYEHVPAVAIGGIDEINALEALSSGVDGIAVVSAIAKADDPAAATRNLAALVKSHFAPKFWTYD